MDFQQIRDFVNPAVAQATGLQEVDNLQMPVPVAYVPVQIVIDGALSLTSENPVQNKVIAVAIQNLDGRITAIEGQFSEGVTEAVNNWLAAHPEATTTVQDGAITYAKLDTNLKGKVDQISELKSAVKVLSEYNSANILQQNGTFNNTTSNGVTIAWDSKHENFTLTGTATGYANFNLITANTAFPSWLKKNKKYALLISNSDSTNVKIQLLIYKNGTSTTTNITGSFAVSFDDDVTGIVLRIRADNNSATYNANVSVRMFERPFEIESTNDTTDRTTDIYAMLQAFSICKLGSGLFYTSGITMANGTTLEGCGNDTILRLKDESTIAVRLGKRCFVKNIKFVGADTRQGGGDTIGTRIGINYTASIQAEEDEQLSCVSQCSFIGFSGAGIQVYSIGHNMLHSISVDQCKFKYNKVGLYLNNLTEFAMVSNCAFNHNYFGSICNGGNNKYVNCIFDGNSKGFVINGSSGAENIGHGSIVGCSFNHNTIVGINVISNANGMIFDACCIYHNKTSQNVDNSIAIDSSVGTHFSNCLMGATDGVSITNTSSQGTMLIGCRFVQATAIPTSVIKANCYLIDGTAM